MPPSRVLWRAASAAELAWAHLDGGHAVHHRPSGLTHLVDALMVALLQDILREPRTLEDAAVQLATAQQSTADDAMLERLADVVGRLEALGLVRRDTRV